MSIWFYAFWGLVVAVVAQGIVETYRLYIFKRYTYDKIETMKAIIEELHNKGFK